MSGINYETEIKTVSNDHDFLLKLGFSRQCLIQELNWSTVLTTMHPKPPGKLMKYDQNMTRVKYLKFDLND